MTNQDTFTDVEKTFLRRLADVIISEAEEAQLPGAGDPQILAKFMTKASGKESRLRSLMTDFLEEFGGISVVAALEDPAFHELAIKWQDVRHSFLRRFITLIAQAYYEDPRVLRAYGKEARAPFPKGNVLPQGDWSLLDNVRDRPPIYRQV
jgi:hypothetical protein